MSTYERIYASPLHDPLFFWLGAAIFVVVLASRMSFFAGFLVVFTFEIAADALLTGGLSPIPKGAWYGTPVAVAFVILGDFRYFLLVERFGDKRRARVATFGMAGVFALVVPVISFALRNLVPALAAPPRVTWFTYEVLFLVGTVVFRFAVLPRRTAQAPENVRRWLLAILSFETVQYGLWAMADLEILFDRPFWFLVRLVPNTMYYVLFLPFVLWRAPPELRSFRGESEAR